MTFFVIALHRSRPWQLRQLRTIPTSKKRLTNVGLILVQCVQRWPSIINHWFNVSEDNAISGCKIHIYMFGSAKMHNLHI